MPSGDSRGFPPQPHAPPTPRFAHPHVARPHVVQPPFYSLHPAMLAPVAHVPIGAALYARLPPSVWAAPSHHVATYPPQPPYAYPVHPPPPREGDPAGSAPQLYHPCLHHAYPPPQHYQPQHRSAPSPQGLTPLVRAAPLPPLPPRRARPSPKSGSVAAAHDRGSSSNGRNAPCEVSAPLPYVPHDAGGKARGEVLMKLGARDGEADLNEEDTNNSNGLSVRKPRKPYTITKLRQSWTKEEHCRFLQALQLYNRDWKKIELHIGTKSVLQIRSHAQKHFGKVKKYNTGEYIPPPRPKKRASMPYPRSRSATIPTETTVSGLASESCGAGSSDGGYLSRSGTGSSTCGGLSENPENDNSGRVADSLQPANRPRQALDPILSVTCGRQAQEKEIQPVLHLSVPQPSTFASAAPSPASSRHGEDSKQTALVAEPHVRHHSSDPDQDGRDAHPELTGTHERGEHVTPLALSSKPQPSDDAPVDSSHKVPPPLQRTEERRVTLPTAPNAVSLGGCTDSLMLLSKGIGMVARDTPPERHAAVGWASAAASRRAHRLRIIRTRKPSPAPLSENVGESCGLEPMPLESAPEPFTPGQADRAAEEDEGARTDMEGAGTAGTPSRDSSSEPTNGLSAPDACVDARGEPLQLGVKSGSNALGASTGSGSGGAAEFVGRDQREIARSGRESPNADGDTDSGNGTVGMGSGSDDAIAGLSGSDRPSSELGAGASLVEDGGSPDLSHSDFAQGEPEEDPNSSNCGSGDDINGQSRGYSPADRASSGSRETTPASNESGRSTMCEGPESSANGGAAKVEIPSSQCESGVVPGVLTAKNDFEATASQACDVPRCSQEPRKDVAAAPRQIAATGNVSAKLLESCRARATTPPPTSSNAAGSNKRNQSVAPLSCSSAEPSMKKSRQE